MLQSFRDNTQSIFVKIIIGFIIITFALFGVDSLIGLAGKPDAPVVVNGAEISERQIVEGVDLQRRQLLRELGADADPALLEDSALREPVIQDLIEREVLKQAAKDSGLYVSDAFLDASIRGTAEFQTDGRFSADRFQAMTRNIGMTPLMYRDYLRNEVLISQHRNSVLVSSFILPEELERIAALDRQTRSFKVLNFDVREALDEVSVSEQEVEAFYQQHAADLRAAEQVSLNYVELNRQQLAESIEIPEAQLRTAYNSLVADFVSEEAREASHILIGFDDQTTEDEARQQAQALKQQLDEGADFAELAKQHSTDPGSAEQGGSLGVVEKGVMVAEFEEALFALEQEGVVSDPVKTDFGYHLIKLESIDRQQPPSFAEARAELLNELRLQQSENLFVSQSSQLDDLRFSSSDLQEASDVLELPIQSTGFFDRDGGDTPLTQAPEVLRAAFSDEVLVQGENSPLIEIDNDHIVVIDLKEHKPDRALELSEVRDEIAAQLRMQKAQQRVTEQAQQRMQAIDNATALNEDDGWQAYDDIARSQAQVSPELADRVFKLPHPVNGQPVVETATLNDGSAVVMVLTAVNDEVPDLSPEQQQGLRAFLASHYGQQEYMDQVTHLKETAEVERNR